MACDVSPMTMFFVVIGKYSKCVVNVAPKTNVFIFQSHTITHGTFMGKSPQMWNVKWKHWCEMSPLVDIYHKGRDPGRTEIFWKTYSLLRQLFCNILKEIDYWSIKVIKWAYKSRCNLTKLTLQNSEGSPGWCVLIMCWWCTDDAMMMHWWYTDDALMMHWWCADDDLMMRQCTMG